MRGMFRRAFRAAKLDRATFREVRGDEMAILNALGIVIVAGIAVAIGMSSAVGQEVTEGVNAGLVGERLLAVWFTSVTLMVGWLVWAGIAYVVGRVFDRNEAGFREVVRVLGVCYGPGMLLVFTAIAPIQWFVQYGVALWMLAAGVVAMREIRRSDWIGAFMDCGLGWFVGVVILPGLLFALYFGPVAGSPS